MPGSSRQSMAAPDPVLTLTSSETAMQEPLRRPADTVSVDTGDERLRSLRRMQGLALGLLGLALIGLMTAHLMGAQGVWGWVRAFCACHQVSATMATPPRRPLRAVPPSTTKAFRTPGIARMASR